MINALTLLIAMSVVAAGIIGWARVVRHLVHGRPILDAAPMHPVGWGILEIVLIVVLTPVTMAIMKVLAVAGGLSDAMPIDAAEMLEGDQPLPMASDLLIYAGAEAFTCVMGFCWLLVRHRTGLAGQGVFPLSEQDLKIGAVAAGTLLLPTFLIQIVVTRYYPTHHPIIELLKDQSGPQFFLASGVLAVLVAPIAEEFLFRVWLQSWLEKLVRFFRESSKEVGPERISGRSLILGDPWVGPQVVQPESDDIQPEHAYLYLPPDTPATSLDGELTMRAPRDEFDENPYRSSGLLVVEGSRDDTAPATAELLEERSVVPILGSALLFALAHIGNGPDPIPLFLLALGLGYIYQRTQRVLPCILIHMACNAISLFALWVSLHSS